MIFAFIVEIAQLTNELERDFNFYNIPNYWQEEMLSVAHLTAMYLKQLGFKRKAYVIASTDALTEELASVGIESLPIGVKGMKIISAPWQIH